MSRCHSSFNATEEQMLVFIYNPSSELCAHKRMQSGDKKKERNQELHLLKPYLPTFGPKRHNGVSAPKLPLTQRRSHTGSPAQGLLGTPPVSGNTAEHNVHRGEKHRVHLCEANLPTLGWGAGSSHPRQGRPGCS